MGHGQDASGDSIVVADLRSLVRHDAESVRSRISVYEGLASSSAGSSWDGRRDSLPLSSRSYPPISIPPPSLRSYPPPASFRPSYTYPDQNQRSPLYDPPDDESAGGDLSNLDWRGGEYQHGVGFDADTVSSAASKKLADRHRALERKFGVGATVVAKAPKSREVMEQERKMEKRWEERETGVNRRGKLIILEGRRKRVALRVLQGAAAFGTGFASIGTAIFNHPSSAPPPAATVPLYLLYVMPFLSLVVTLYFHVFRACLRTSPGSSNPPAANFVVPLLQGGKEYEGGIGCCCFARNGKRSRGGGDQAQTINLIVDQSMFPNLTRQSERTDRDRRRRRRKRRERRERAKEAEGDSDDDSLSSASDSSEDSSDENPRVGSTSMAKSDERWRAARGFLKRVTVSDGLIGVMWLAVVIYVVAVGQRCPAGAFDGWCNFYNSSIALSVFVLLCFATSFVLDCLDLKRTKNPPRSLNFA